MTTRRIGTTLLAAAALALLCPGLAWAQSFEPIINISKSAGNSIQPHMVLDGAGTLHVAWSDDTNQPGSAEIFYARSFDQARTFTPPVKLSSSANGSFRPRLAVHGSIVYAVWTEDVSDTKDVIFTRSLDGGATFEAPRNISNTPGESREARIAVNAAGTVFVVWDEATGGRHIAIAGSSDQGASFSYGTIAPLVRLLTDCPADSSPSACTAYPGLAVDPTRPNNVYVTWHDRLAPTTNARLDVFFSRSTDGGAHFGPPQNVSSTVGIHAHCASLNVGPSGKILVAFESRKLPAPQPHSHDSMLVQSADGGASFTPPLNVSNSPSLALSDYPWAVESPNGSIAVAYEDNAVGGELDAVVKLSSDGGATFGPRLNLSNNPQGTSTEVVALYGADGTLYVLWEDHGSGDESTPGEILLARTAGSSGPPMTMALNANQGAFRPGQPATVTVTASNPGSAQIVDIYFGVALPMAAGPLYGCPGEVPFAFETGPSVFTVVCGSRVLQDARPLMTSVFVPGAMPPITVPMLSFVWPGGLPAGTYHFFLTVTPPGGFATGNIVSGAAVDLNYAP